MQKKIMLLMLLSFGVLKDVHAHEVPVPSKSTIAGFSAVALFAGIGRNMFRSRSRRQSEERRDEAFVAYCEKELAQDYFTIDSAHSASLNKVVLKRPEGFLQQQTILWAVSDPRGTGYNVSLFKHATEKDTQDFLRTFLPHKKKEWIGKGTQAGVRKVEVKVDGVLSKWCKDVYHCDYDELTK